MKKFIILLGIILICLTTLLSEEPAIKKITIDNQQGYFINHAYYQQILILDNECLSLRQQIIILEQNNLMLVDLNYRLKKQIDEYLKTEKQIKIKNNLLLASGIANLILLSAGIIEGVILYNQSK